MRAKISKWGNSLGVRLPKALAEQAGLREGQVVELSARPGGLGLRVVTPTPRYTLEELVAEMDRLGPENRPELIDWGPDVGAEIIDDDYSKGLVAPSGRGPRVARPAPNPGKRATRREASRRSH